MKMTPQDILKEIAALSEADRDVVQQGMAEMWIANLSQEEIAEINQAIDEADAEFARGEGMSSAEARKRLGLK